MSWSNRDEDWKNAKLLFKRRGPFLLLSPASDLKAPNIGEDDVVSFFIFLSSRTKNGPQWLSVENSGGYKKGMFISIFLSWTLVSVV